MDPPATKPLETLPGAPVTENAKPVEAAAKVLEFAKFEPAPLPARVADPPKIAPLSTKASLDVEELKIPSWLEPLARNAAAPSSTQELVEREKAKRVAEQPSGEEIPSESGAVEEEYASELPMPNFGGELRIDASEDAVESSSRKSPKALWIAAIAAGALLLAGGGVWYFRQQSSDVHAGSAPVTKQAPALSASAGTLPPQGNTAPQTSSPAPTASAVPANAPLQTSLNSSPSGAESAGAA